MISIGKLVNVDQVVRYLVEATHDIQVEYYTVRGNTPGRWMGPAAKHLGLSGEVTSEQLRTLLNGRDPRSGAELMQRRWASQSVVAFDVTFSAPKSVSLLWAVGDDAARDAVMRAHQTAVDAVCEYLQTHAGWGRRYDRELGDVVAVRAQLALPQFNHHTSRPVTEARTGQVTVDPQLHTHIPIPNFVLRDDGTWGQMHSPPLYRHAASAGAVGQAVLRHELVRELGVAVDVSPNGSFEVRGITRAMRQEFSRRTRQVAAMDEAFGVDSWYGHKVAVLASREGKGEVTAAHDQFAEWRQRAATVGLDRELVTALLGQQQLLAEEHLTPVVIREIVGERGMTAEAATFARRDLVRALAARAPLGATLGQLERTAERVLADPTQVVVLGELSDRAAAELPASYHAYAEHRYSTPEMVAIEERMLATAQAGRLAGRGLAFAADVDRAIAARPNLTGEQQTMIHAICRRGEALTLIEGSAGSGKTYALAACREALEAAGHRVEGAALSAKAANKLGEEAGIPTTTVHSLLHRLQGAPEGINTVLILDEAGMVGSRQIAQLIEYAERDQAKLVLVGDRHQLQPIDGGAAVRALEERLGCVTLTENVRQAEGWERTALAALRDGSVAAAVRAYREHEAIVTASRLEPDELRTKMLTDYHEAVSQGRDAIMLAHRRTDVAFLNARAHQYAGLDGRLKGPAIEVGSRVVDRGGRLEELPKQFRAGDIALCLANDNECGLTNGMRAQVIAVDPSIHSLTLRTPDNREVTIDTRHYDALDHGYAMTVHKAQGLTADIALVLASGEEGREWTYTAMSRGRENNIYYTPGGPPMVDERGRVVWDESDDRLTDRLTKAWERTTAADSTLDYERLQERQLAHAPVPYPQPQLTPSYTPDFDTPDLSPSIGPSSF